MISKYTQHPAYKIIESACRREQQRNMIVSGFLFVAGAALAYFFYVDVFIVGMFGGLMAIGSLGTMIYFLFAQNADPQSILFILDNKPDRVVWVYSVATTVMPYGFRMQKKGLMYFWMDDGDVITLNLPAQNLKLVSRFLNRVIPNAVFGYSAEKEQMYQRKYFR